MTDLILSLQGTKRGYRLAVSILFFLQGICFASWASRIPSIQQALGLTDASLGIILLALPVGSMIPKATLLIENGADINAIDEEYLSTPLGLAAKWGHTKMVEFLLKQGADPNKSGAKWSTPLGWAKKKGHVEIEEMLNQ